jgi:NitT/TauT family transport system permease protein
MLAAKIMGANKWQIFHKIIFWESLPHTIVSFRYAISLSLVVIIVTEMFIGTNSGIGKKIIDFQFIYDIKGVYVMIFLTGIIGYFLNKGISILESHVIHWSKN